MPGQTRYAPSAPLRLVDPPFEHEKLDVYRTALEFVALATEIVNALPRGRSAFADQLERASTSIAFNTAEGCGEYSRREKARFFRMALRSASECSAILDVGLRMRVVAPPRHERGKVLVGRLAAMLTALAKQNER